MIRLIAAVLFAMHAASTAIAGERLLFLDDCEPLAYCLSTLDQSVQDENNRYSSGDEQMIAKILDARFGDDARAALLERAAGPDPDWRGFSAHVLEAWPGNPPDLIALYVSVLRENPDGWAADALADTRDPAAMAALVEALATAGPDSKVAHALIRFREKALPALFPMLADPDLWPTAYWVIHEMSPWISNTAHEWASIARDVDAPLDQRLGALRGIAAYGPGTFVHGLWELRWHDPDPVIRQAAYETMVEIRHPATLTDETPRCVPMADAYDPYAFDSHECLEAIAERGGLAIVEGPDVLPFLDSANGTEQALAIETLGRIGYVPAVDQIVGKLRSSDWRVVMASVLALGWLKNTSAIPALELTAKEHWLPEIRDLAGRAIAAIEDGQDLEAPQNYFPFGEGTPHRFGFSSHDLAPLPACGQAVWQDHVVAMQPVPGRFDEAPIPGGTLYGEDWGEFGGHLEWTPDGGNPVRLHEDNVLVIIPDGQGAFVLFGTNHMGLNQGYLARFTPLPSGEWTFVLSAWLTGYPTQWGSIGSGQFMVYAAERPLIFDETGIVGMADCSRR